MSQPAVNKSANEITDRLRALTDAEWMKLRLIARYHCNGRGLGHWTEPTDLLQEALLRTLDGSRNCPSGVAVIKFLDGVMRSLADGEWEKHSKRPVLVAIAGHGGEPGIAPDPVDVRPDSEKALLYTQARQRLIDLFKDDAEAQIIVEGMMDGMDGQELRDLTELDPVAYDSKRRLIRRRINKDLANGEPDATR